MRGEHVDPDGPQDVEFWRDYADTGLWGTAAYFLPHLSAMPERAGAVLAAVRTHARVASSSTACRDATGRASSRCSCSASSAWSRTRSWTTYLETVRRADALAAATGRENDEPAREAILARRGTGTEQAFRDALAGLDLDAFLGRAGLSAGTQRRLRTWRGSVTAGDGTR